MTKKYTECKAEGCMKLTSILHGYCMSCVGKGLAPPGYHKYKRRLIARYKRMKGCSICGIKVPAVLDLHHERGDRKFWLGSVQAVSGHTLDEVRAELRKCEVLCANHHRIITTESDPVLRSSLLQEVGNVL